MHDSPAQKSPDWGLILTYTALALIMLAGYGLRSVGRNWDDYTHLHPDERFLTDVASRVNSSPLNLSAPALALQKATCDARYPGPSPEDLQGLNRTEQEARLARTGMGGYFDAECSNLNPNNIGFGLYVYGQYPLFSVRVAGESTAQMTYMQCMAAATSPEDEQSCQFSRNIAPQLNYNGIHLVGRTMSSLADTLTILLVFLIALKLFGRPQAILAALFYAFAAFPIQQSHFWTVDAFTALWVALSLYAAVNVLKADHLRPIHFNPLPPLTAALALWALDIPNLDAPTILPILLYGVAAGLIALAFTARPQSLILIPLALIPLLGGFSQGYISSIGLGLALALMAILGALYFFGLGRLLAEGGAGPWLAAGAGLWVYDSLAHEQDPNFFALVIFGLLFTVGAIWAGLLKNSQSRADSVFWSLVIGAPLLIWVGLVALMGAASWEAMIWALLTLAALVPMTVYGYRDYALFGLAFGAALASRVNIAPLVGVLILAVLIRALPLLDFESSRAERYRLATRSMSGLILAAVLTLTAFRLLQPHAFLGTYDLPLVGNLGLLPAGLNPGWTDDIGQAQFLVSGQSDIPPNHQWANRTPWLFPGQNIVLYGLGWGLGLAAVLGFILALVRTLTGRPEWTRLALPIAWVGVYFGWLGANWVTTMRYFLPIYSSLVILAAWALLFMLSQAWAYYQSAQQARRPLALPRLALGGASLALGGVLIYTLLYGYGMTAIYRHLLTRTAASLWFQENVPGDFGLWIETAEGDYVLQNLATGPVNAPAISSHLPAGTSIALPLTLPSDYLVQSVTLHRLSDPDRDPGEENLRISFNRVDELAMFPELVGERVLTADFNAGYSDFGDSYTVRFDDDPAFPLTLSRTVPGTPLQASYELELKIVGEGGALLSRNVSDNIYPPVIDHISILLLDAVTGDPLTLGLKLDDDKQRNPYSYYMPGQRQQINFTARADGVIAQIDIPHLADPLQDADAETLRLSLTGPEGQVSSGVLSGNYWRQNDGLNTFGPAVSIPLDPPMVVEAGLVYNLGITVDQPLMMMGHVVATEGPWDDPLPYKVCPLPEGVALDQNTASGYSRPTCIGVELYSGHYYGLELFIVAEDDENKRQTLLTLLDQADYLTLSSNRFYDTLSRIPYRWPLTLDYYRALFDGSLGFELVHQWESYPRIPELGLEWKNQVLPTDDLAAWMNEFEAEEAFHVYDHPAVFVFRKTPAYSPANTAQILDTSVRQYKEAFGGFLADEAPVNRLVVIAPQASAAPTALMLPESAPEPSAWRDLYNPDSWLNRSQTAAVLAWWAFMILLGWAVYPLLYTLLPALPDRGYSAAKMFGLVLAAWLAWFGASLHLGTWSQAAIPLIIFALFWLGLCLVLARGGEFWAYLRRNRWHFLFVEALGALLYLAFVYVRYRNPDLWHNNFGGEKPMDFAYLNAVLRSESFPPLDPWFSGGYINYYYWGFVMAGLPIKALGLVPAIGYNLAIPTLFSLTGMGAFAVAYNVVAARRLFPSRMPYANPYIAGISALILVAVVGNLDTLRVFVTETAKVGGWSDTFDPAAERQEELLTDFRAENGREPTLPELEAITAEAADIPTISRLRYSASDWWAMGRGFVRGLDKISQGEPFLMATHRWYWAPTRLIAELPEGRGHNAIAEMPYFTFLYGDLHAHMMAMPLMLLVMLWLGSEILAAGRKLRTPLAAALSLLLGGVLVGLLRPTNTWDLPSFLILTTAGLFFGLWLTQKSRMEGANLAPSAGFADLRRYLDVGYALRLWPLLLAIPAGFVLYSGLWLLHTRSYQDDLAAGLIPIQCQQISQNGLAQGLRLPLECEGKLEPAWTASGAVVWGVGLFAVGIGAYLLLLVCYGVRLDRRALWEGVGRIGAFLLISFASVYPFTYWYAGEAGLKPWTADRTPLWAYMNVHGLFLFILFSWLVWKTARALKSFRVADLYGLSLPVLLILMGIPLTLALTLLIGLTMAPVMLITLPMILWGSLLFLLPGTSRAERFILALMILALGLTAGVEWVVLDVDIGRQNMVFKFYIQAWLLFGVSSGVALAWLLGSLPDWWPGWRAVWQTALGALLCIAFMYPIMATQARWLDRFDATRTGNTLDGQAYMEYAVYGDNLIWYSLRGDRAMIDWLNQNLTGTPNIIEAQSPEYRWGSRIAINTGLPTVIGWNWHQRQQRSVLSLNQLVWNRSNNVAAFYQTTDIAVAQNLLEFYEIEYIILGVQERVVYGDLQQDHATGRLTSGLSAGLAKFEQMADQGLLEVVYESPTCVGLVPLDAEDCPEGNLVMDRVYKVVSQQ